MHGLQEIKQLNTPTATLVAEHLHGLAYADLSPRERKLADVLRSRGELNMGRDGILRTRP